MEFDCGFKKENNWFRYRAAAIIIENNCVLFARNELDDYYYSIGGGVHMNETSEEAVIREVYEETGVQYEIDHLVAIHENFFDGEGSLAGYQCHELAMYYLMKPRGTQELHSNSYTQGVREHMHWLALDSLEKYRAYPSFIREVLRNAGQGIVHIVTDERKRSQ